MKKIIFPFVAALIQSHNTKPFFITLLILQLGFASFAQHAFELVFGEPEISDAILHTLEHQGHYYALGSKTISSESIYHRASVIYKISPDGEIIDQAYWPKPDTTYGIEYGIPKPNGNFLCFGTLSPEPNLRWRHTYVCEISPNLDLIWEKTDTILEPHPHARHRLRNFLITPDNEVIIQGVVDTVLYGNNHFIFLAKYDFEGNRLDYKSFLNYLDNDHGSLILNADSTGFYLFGQLEVKPAARSWIEFDLELDYLGSGILESNQTIFLAPATAERLSNGNIVIANRFFETGTNKKGMEMRLYNPDLQLLKSILIYHTETIKIPEHRGMGFIDENNIWVATFEMAPPSWPGIEDFRFFIFDNEINLKGSKVHEGDTRYWLYDLLATSDTGCLVSGVVGENVGSNTSDNYIMKVRLQDVLTGIQEQERKTGRTVEIWPVPAGETLHVKSSQDSELLIFNTAGEKIREHNIKEGYNIITLKAVPPGKYLIAIRQNGMIIESHKVIKK